MTNVKLCAKTRKYWENIEQLHLQAAQALQTASANADVEIEVNISFGDKSDSYNYWNCISAYVYDILGYKFEIEFKRRINTEGESYYVYSVPKQLQSDCGVFLVCDAYSYVLKLQTLLNARNKMLLHCAQLAQAK